MNCSYPCVYKHSIYISQLKYLLRLLLLECTTVQQKGPPKCLSVSIMFLGASNNTMLQRRLHQQGRRFTLKKNEWRELLWKSCLPPSQELETRWSPWTKQWYTRTSHAAAQTYANGHNAWFNHSEDACHCKSTQVRPISHQARTLNSDQPAAQLIRSNLIHS